MVDLHLSPEQIEFREMVRNFAANEIRPIALKPERLEAFAKPFLEDLLSEASALGLRTLMLSEDAGGVGGDMLSACIVLEELATGDVDISVAMGRTMLLAHELFDVVQMSDGQRKKFLDAFHNDQTVHLAYTGGDPNAALGWHYHDGAVSDDAVLPSANADGDDYVIDGTIEHVANAPIAKLFAVEVNTGSGASVLLVPRDTDGLSVSEPSDVVRGEFVRWHHGTAAKVEFKSCRVPKENLLGVDGKNSVHSSDYFVRDRLQRAAINLGLGQVAFETTVDYAHIRHQGAKNIVEHENIGAKIADMASKLELARTMIWKAAWAIENPDAVGQGSLSNLPLDIVASTYTAQSVLEISEIATECFGAMGVMRDMPLHQFVHDSLVFAHGDGHDIATVLRIAESAVGYSRAFAA